MPLRAPDLGTPPPPSNGDIRQGIVSIGPHPVFGYSQPEHDGGGPPTNVTLGDHRAVVPAGNVRDEVARQAAAHGVPRAVAQAVAWHMSGLNQSHVSAGGNVGVMGLDPQVARARMTNPYDWRDNIRGGVAALKELHDKHGNWKAAVKEYGLDPGKVAKTSRKVDTLGPGFTGNVRVAPPLPGNPTVGAGVGQKAHGYHAGVDIISPSGTPVAAMIGGKVLRAHASNGGAGTQVVIEDKQGRQWAYGHLGGVSVKPGQVVKPGEQLGEVGQTGNATGPVLHIQLTNKRGGYENPTSVIQRAFAKGPKGGTIQISDTDFKQPMDGGPSAGGLPVNVNTPPPAQGPPIPLPPNVPPPPPVAPVDAHLNDQMTALANAGPTSPELQNLQKRAQTFQGGGV